MIAIGADVGGTELVRCKVVRAIGRAMNAAADLCPTFADGDTPSVNVVFHLPGSVHAPDWQGLRAERFTRKKKLMLVSVAVPLDVVHSHSASDFVIESLHAANKLAFQTFHKKGIEFPLADAEALVDRVAEEVAKTTD